MNGHGPGVRILLAVSLICLQPVMLPGKASAQMNPALQATLQWAKPQETVPVIITFADQTQSVSPALQGGIRSRAAMIRSLRAASGTREQDIRGFLQAHGAREMRSLWLINGLAVTATPDVIRQMADMPGVLEVRRDRLHHKADMLMQTAPGEYNIDQVAAPALWALGHFGQGVTVALMDTGADVRHPDLAGSWRGGSNSWLDPYGQYTTPFDSDPSGHGTGVLGIMVAGDASGTTVGMAPKARWIAARLFDDADTASDSAIHQIFQWFLDPDGDPDTDDAPDVVNGSWGLLDANSQPGACIGEFQPDITALNAAGIAAVFAAGNYGPDAATSVSPANNAGAIAVGAVDSDGIFNLSSRGPSTCDGRIYPDVVAPGVSIKTTDRSFGGLLNYAVGSGTSFAAPHASGALALLAGAFPQAAQTDLKDALLASALDLGGAGPDNDYGNGRINLDDAAGAYAYLQNTMGLTPCVRPEIAFSASPLPGDVGQPITFAATASGGSGSYTYEWDIDGDGAPEYTNSGSTPSDSIQHTYAAPYAGSVGLKVTDASAAPGCSSQVVVADQWACPNINVSISALPDPGVAGQPVGFNSTVSGGTPPYVYAWDLDDNGSIDCSSETCTNTYSAAFSGNVSLTVTDSTGCRATFQASLSVQAASQPVVSSAGGGGGGGCFIDTLLNMIF